MNVEILVVIIQGIIAITLAWLGYQSKKTHDIVNSQRTEMLAKIDNLEKKILPLNVELAARQEEIRILRNPEPPLVLIPIPPDPPPLQPRETRRPK